jgi:hypothetical protein
VKINVGDDSVKKCFSKEFFGNVNGVLAQGDCFGAGGLGLIREIIQAARNDV